MLGLLTRSSTSIDPNSSVIWVDSDPNIRQSTGLLEAQNWRVACFNETADALNALRQNRLIPDKINCIITSMMERGGRRERGLLNGLQMLDEMKTIWKEACSYCPLIAIITLTADVQECQEHGATVIVHGDRRKMLLQVIDLLNKSPNSEHREKWREPSLLPCLQLREIAKAYLDTLNLDRKYFDTFCDHCFCKTCSSKRIWERCNEKYALPIGYYRFGLLLRNEFNERRADVQNWPVAYHGTRRQNIDSILRHRRIMFPGDRLDDGTVLPVRLGQCHALGSPVIYVSPTILYSQHDVYTPPEHFHHGSPFNSTKYKIKTVLQCRVKPESFRKCRETLGFNNIIIDQDFNNNEVEWVVSDKTAVVPYGLLIGIFPE
ncbi:hypothetical protein I4U23_011589 [Adineta vaga]|nr:hypothetical protein I4U23_011589 [Adineta vaga]